MVLVPDVVDAIAPVPVLAAGGIGSGRQMAAAMALGAEGVWTGSIWLTVAENDTGPEGMDRLLAATVARHRAVAVPHRQARAQLRTAWTEAWERADSPGTLPMPLQFMATQTRGARIARSDATASSSACPSARSSAA